MQLFSGIISKRNEKVEYLKIEKMNSSSVFRSSKMTSKYYSGDIFTFACTKVDDNDTSDQNISMYQDRYVIIYSGKIYNCDELKNVLLKGGYYFVSETVEELIAAAYDKWNCDCVMHFNGAWGLVIYDKIKNVIFCSRDRFGVSSFYYHNNENNFIFGMTIKQLLALITPEVNKSVLIDFLVTGISEHSAECFFSDIYKLPAGCNLIYNLKTHEFQIQRYYTISFDKNLSNLSENEAINYYADMLKSVINMQVDTNSKCASCLSGGLDSSSLAVLAAENANSNLKEVIHAKSLEVNSDESYFAKLVADEVGLKLNLIEPSVEEFQNHLEDVVYTQEEPFASASVCMQYFVMKKASELGIKILLDGQGGDETLLGYERYYIASYMNILKNKGIFETIKAVKASKKNNSKMSFLRVMFFSIYFMCSYIRIHILRKKTHFLKNYDNNFSFLKRSSKKITDINALQIHEIIEMNLPALLRYDTKNSIRFGIDVALPFLNHKVLETALSIDVGLKIKDGWSKYILRRIISGKISDTIVWRKNKFGFEAPENMWMNSLNIAQTVFESNILSAISDMQELKSKFDSLNKRLKWRLFSIALWEKVFNVEI